MTNKENSQKNSLPKPVKIALWTLAVFVLIPIGAASNKEVPAIPAVQPTAAVASEPAQPAAPKTWHKVAELSGSSSKRSDVFKLDSSKQRLVYTIDGAYSPFLNVYLMREGKSLDVDGGIPEVMMAGFGGETLTYKGSGGYYLDIMANGEWTVIVEEER